MLTTTIVAAIRDYGLPTVAAAVAIYIIVRGEIVFRYPAKRGDRPPNH